MPLNEQEILITGGQALKRLGDVCVYNREYGTVTREVTQLNVRGACRKHRHVGGSCGRKRAINFTCTGNQSQMTREGQIVALVCDDNFEMRMVSYKRGDDSLQVV